MLSVTEIRLNKPRAHFRPRFAPMIWGTLDLFRTLQAGKCARSLFNCISVTDGIQINEQNKSIVIGPLYLQPEFEVI